MFHMFHVSSNRARTAAGSVIFAGAPAAASWLFNGMLIAIVVKPIV